MLSTDAAAIEPCAFLPAEDRRAMLPIQEAAILLDVDPELLKRQHRADPVNYPAGRVGTRWRIPRWWVEQKIACMNGAQA